MFGSAGGHKLRPTKRLEEYPSFGPVQQTSHARGPVFLIAGILLVATLCTGASLTLAGGATANPLHGSQSAAPPTALQGGCDGAWGNEPLDCLLQSA